MAMFSVFVFHQALLRVGIHIYLYLQNKKKELFPTYYNILQDFNNSENATTVRKKERKLSSVVQNLN